MTSAEILRELQEKEQKRLKERINKSVLPGDIVYSYGIPMTEQSCKHEWRVDQWFTTMKYETCKKCGAKKEEQ